MWELDYKESWALKNGCFWTVVLEKTLVSPLDCKEIQPVHPKGDQSWAFIGRSDVEAETPVLWPPHAKSWLIWKDPDAGEDWGQEEKGTTENEMVEWHHWLNGHEFGWTPGVGEGQRGLGCCSPWGCKESDMTEWLNWTELNLLFPWIASLHPCRNPRRSLFYRQENWDWESQSPLPSVTELTCCRHQSQLGPPTMQLLTTGLTIKVPNCSVSQQG